jgi:integrating conjugative element protein (TIGR03755 family)
MKIIQKIFLVVVVFCFSSCVFALDIIPTGKDNNLLYYKMGGGSDFDLPAVNDTRTIDLGADADLSAGMTCGDFNPLVSLTNTFNDLQNNIDNITQGLLANATGSLAEMPMYFLAQANPSAYNMINNALIKAHELISISTKSCQEVKNQIAQGKNPYQDWATISVGNSWKKHLSLTFSGSEDINDAKKDIDANAGNDGVPWINGNKSDSGFLAGGLNQPPIHVVSDTVKAGYNAILMRDTNDSSPASVDGELAKQFPSPKDAQDWITNVVGDQVITTCNDKSCQKNQGGISGRGLLPWITNCNEDNKSYCADNIKKNINQLVSGQLVENKSNIELVSANGLVISPQVISAIKNMDATQQNIMTAKLSQEVATQKVVDRALIARNILQTGAQVPVIASNTPAQKMISHSIEILDKDIQSIAFESQIRKQMMSNTINNILNAQNLDQQKAVNVPAVIKNTDLIQNSALPNHK